MFIGDITEIHFLLMEGYFSLLSFLFMSFLLVQEQYRVFYYYC